MFLRKLILFTIGVGILFTTGLGAVTYNVQLQTQLSDENGLLNDTYDVVVNLYSDSSSSSPSWTETFTDYSFTEGVFSEDLGDVASLTPDLFTFESYFSIQVGDFDEVLVTFSAVPTALVAASANMASTVFSNDTTTINADVDNDGVGEIQFYIQDTQYVTLDQDGDFGIGNTAPAYTLDVTGTANITSDLFVGGTLSGDGSGLTNLNFTNSFDTSDYLTLGGVTANVVTVNTLSSPATYLVIDSGVTVDGRVTANSFYGTYYGDGSNLTGISTSVDENTALTVASVSSNGTVSANYFVGDGSQLSNLSISLGSGDVTTTEILDNTITSADILNTGAFTFGELSVLGQVTTNYLLAENGASFNSTVFVDRIESQGNFIVTTNGALWIQAKDGLLTGSEHDLFVAADTNDSGDGTIEFSIGGVEVGEFSSDGYFGLATGTPAYLLDVDGTANMNTLIVNGDASIVDDLTVGGTITANAFSGDGSQLTNLTVSLGSGDVTSTEILNNTITSADILNTGAFTFGELSVLGQVTANNLIISESVTINSYLTVESGVSVDGTVTADYFVGDGSGLTNLNVSFTIGEGDVTTTEILDNTITSADISNTGAFTFGELSVLGQVTANNLIISESVTINSYLTVESGVSVDGTVTADYFVGDGSQLTNISLSDNSVTSADISNTGSFTFGELSVLGQVTANNLIISESVTINSYLTVESGVSVDGTVTADYFVGDGSLLSNLTVSSLNMSNSSATINILSVRSLLGDFNNVLSLYGEDRVQVTSDAMIEFFINSGSNPDTANMTITDGVTRLGGGGSFGVAGHKLAFVNADTVYLESSSSDLDIYAADDMAIDGVNSLAMSSDSGSVELSAGTTGLVTANTSLTLGTNGTMDVTTNSGLNLNTNGEFNLASVDNIRVTTDTLIEFFINSGSNADTANMTITDGVTRLGGGGSFGVAGHKLAFVNASTVYLESSSSDLDIYAADDMAIDGVNSLALSSDSGPLELTAGTTGLVTANTSLTLGTNGTMDVTANTGLNLNTNGEFNLASVDNIRVTTDTLIEFFINSGSNADTANMTITDGVTRLGGGGSFGVAGHKLAFVNESTVYLESSSSDLDIYAADDMAIDGVNSLALSSDSGTLDLVAGTTGTVSANSELNLSTYGEFNLASADNMRVTSDTQIEFFINSGSNADTANMTITDGVTRLGGGGAFGVAGHKLAFVNESTVYLESSSSDLDIYAADDMAIDGVNSLAMSSDSGNIDLTAGTELTVTSNTGLFFRSNKSVTVSAELELHLMASDNMYLIADHFEFWTEDGQLRDWADDESGDDIWANIDSGLGGDLFAFKTYSGEKLGAISKQYGGDFYDNRVGIKIESGGADYAEFLPRLYPDEDISGGDVVGVYAGKITRRTEGADKVMVVSTMPIVLGNWKNGMELVAEPVAFIGQVPVRVIGKVQSGDYVIPSNAGDGTAIAVSESDITPEQARVVIGQAWESSDEDAEKLVNVAITPYDSLPESVKRISDENKVLKAEIEGIKAELEILKQSILN